MTRKDVEAIALAIATAPLNANTRAATALHIAYALRDTNPRFDLNRFVKACLPTTA